MLRLPPDIKKVMGEEYDQQFKAEKKVVPLPCSENHKWKEPAMVEITRSGDQVICCPICGKKHYLTWSPIHENLKWQK